MEADWGTDMTGQLDASAVRRGVTGAFTPPLGGGDFVYGFNSVDSAEGVVALYRQTPDNFAPFSNPAAGGRVAGAIQRKTGAAATGFAPFFFICAQSAAVSAVAYILGLGDGNPSHVVLRKGALSGGLPDVAPDATGDAHVLARSTLSLALDAWAHLRLQAAKNSNGDVALKAQYNDLTLPGASVASPVWIDIPGLDLFIDDHLGINTGTVPLYGGYAGFGFYTNGVTRRALIDHVKVERQSVV